MLISNRHRKLIFLKILLVTIICLILSITINKGIKIYQSISLLSASKLTTWLNTNCGDHYIVSVGDLKITWKKFIVYLEINNLLLRSKSLENPISFSMENATSATNVLNIILAGKLKIKNFIANNINITSNHLYQQQKISVISGSITIGFNPGLINTLSILGDLKTSNMNFLIESVWNIGNNNINLSKFKLNYYDTAIREIIKFLPEKFIGEKLYLWLDSALLSGNLKSADLLVLPKNDFSLNIDFKDVMFRYADGWPLVEHLDANLKIVNDNLQINMLPNALRPATILNQPINKLMAKIPSISLAQSPPLEVYTQINAPVAHGINFLKTVNTLKAIGENLADLTLQGKMALTLKLTIPIDASKQPTDPIIYRGNLQIKEGNLKLLHITADELLANIAFGNNYITTEKCKMKISKLPVSFDFKLNEDHLIFNSNAINLNLLLPKSFNKDFSFKNLKNLQFHEFSVFQQRLSNVSMRNEHDKIYIDFNEPMAKGSISYNKYFPHEYEITLDQLKLSTQQIHAIENDYQRWIAWISACKFHAKELYIDEVYLGEVNFNVAIDYNDLDLIKKLTISDLKLRTANLDSNALVVVSFNPNNTLEVVIGGRLNTTNFGSGLRELNLDTKLITNGNGSIDFNLDFIVNKLKSIEFSDITANLRIDIRSGFVLSFDPGIGRILGLLNIENIARRLKFDFSDLTNRGFSFDLLKGDLSFKQGKLRFDNIMLKGPAADITLRGTASVVSKQLDLIASVTQKTGATVPLAAAVAAGNPVIGAAVWLFDYASGAKLSQMKIKKYKITGNWNDPKIQDLIKL